MPTDVALERPGTREVRTETVRESPEDVAGALRGAPGGRVVLTGLDGEPIEVERRLVMWYRAAA
ncbi:hypothetical protein [Patulibacter sp.]|uniref:hypothetical protein n=1 Tax=Patulibacter sp. TaxID=1912859 RepID=UPI0027245ED9|nr:hypothetical protein [Patulibacter sp.]MDO9408463.1 hypothetical protein [Patulibacter sp.]